MARNVYRDPTDAQVAEVPALAEERERPTFVLISADR